MKQKKNKILSILLAALIFATCAIPAYALGIPGDVDLDGEVTAEDARLILRYSVKLEAPNTVERRLADLDNDGAITAADARLALRLAVNLDSLFNSVLYQVAHPLFWKSFSELNPPGNRNLLDYGYYLTANWCCYYTIKNVYRPVLKELGYSDDVIEKYAPSRYSSDKLSKVAESFFGIPMSSLGALGEQFEWYIPSLLADYYISSPEYADTYVFWDYYDDMIAGGVIERTDNTEDYKPQVGDILFMSNKLESYIDGVPTIDHTAQIIMVKEDGTFWCTEGGIIQNGEDGVARVRERLYYYNEEKGTYVWELNDVVDVLMVARPLLP